MRCFWWQAPDPLNEGQRAGLYICCIEADNSTVVQPFYGSHAPELHTAPDPHMLIKLMESGYREISWRTATRLGWPI